MFFFKFSPVHKTVLNFFFNIFYFRFIVYKKNSDGTINPTKFNFDQIPIDNAGQREVRMFVNTIRTVLDQIF